MTNTGELLSCIHNISYFDISCPLFARLRKAANQLPIFIRAYRSIVYWGYWDISVMSSIESYLTLLITLFMTQLHES
jgi:hypothetical protein